MEPRLLIDAGRIQPKPVLVITSLHNTKHSQVMLLSVLNTVEPKSK